MFSEVAARNRVSNVQLMILNRAGVFCLHAVVSNKIDF